MSEGQLSPCSLSSSSSSSSSIILQPFTFPLSDAVNNLSLDFRPSVYLSAPPNSPITSLESLQSHLLLRSPSLSLQISITINKDPLPTSSVLLAAWARCISSAKLWSQLDFTTSLSIFSSTDIRVALTRASAVESMLPDIAMDGVTLDEIHMQFDFTPDASDGGYKNERSVQAHELIPLTDTAVRSFMMHSFFIHMAPLVGLPGVVKACDERILPVEVLAEVLSRKAEGAGHRKEVEHKIWETVVRNTKVSRKLAPIVWDAEARNEDGGMIDDGGQGEEEGEEEGKENWFLDDYDDYDRMSNEYMGSGED